MLDTRQAIEQAKTKWNELPIRRKILIGLVVATIPAILISLGIWANRPDYKVLFSNLSPEDSQAIEDELRAGGIPYKTSDGGRTISVPSSEVYKTHLRLACPGRGRILRARRQARWRL
ncbi:MAG: hypothetical protein ACPL7B_15180, partial [Candidatus Poribacteria bacterium]